MSWDLRHCLQVFPHPKAPVPVYRQVLRPLRVLQRRNQQVFLLLFPKVFLHLFPKVFLHLFHRVLLLRNLQAQVFQRVHRRVFRLRSRKVFLLQFLKVYRLQFLKVFLQVFRLPKVTVPVFQVQFHRVFRSVLLLAGKGIQEGHMLYCQQMIRIYQ